MAVKVMIAPVIASGEVDGPASERRREAAPAGKRKRRRSSVYDADGNEVFITLICLKCHKTRPLSQFGLRKMADGAIRNQPWCRSCRSALNPPKPQGKGSTETVDSSAADPSSLQAAEATPAAPASRRPASSVAAEVAAALAAGLRR